MFVGFFEVYFKEDVSSALFSLFGGLLARQTQTACTSKIFRSGASELFTIITPQQITCDGPPPDPGPRRGLSDGDGCCADDDDDNPPPMFWRFKGTVVIGLIVAGGCRPHLACSPSSAAATGYGAEPVVCPAPLRKSLTTSGGGPSAALLLFELWR